MGCEPHQSFKRKNKANGIVIKKSKEDKSEEMKLIKKPKNIVKYIKYLSNFFIDTYIFYERL